MLDACGKSNLRSQQQFEIIVARWTDTRTEDRREVVVARMASSCWASLLGRHASVAERPGDHLRRRDGVRHDLRLPPIQTVHAEFAGPADFLHLYVAGGSIHKQQHAK